MTSYKQKTRTRELYSQERLSDDGDLTSGGGPDGRSSLLGTISSTSPHELLWTSDRLKLFRSRRG